MIDTPAILRNASGFIPRTPAEWQAQVKAMEPSPERIIEKAERENQRILEARQWVEFMKTDAYTSFEKLIDGRKQDIATIRDFTGGLLDKAGQLENAQGQIAVLDWIGDMFDDYLRTAEHEPADINKLKESYAANQEG